MKVFKYQEIEFDNILIGKNKFNDDHSYMEIRYKNDLKKTPLLIKTSSLKINDISNNIIRGTYIENIILDNRFLKFLNDLDNFFINKLTEKSEIIFNEKKNVSYIKEIFKRSINFDNNKFISKFNYLENNNNNNNTLLFNENKENITLNDLKNNN